MGKDQGGGAYDPGTDARLDFIFDHCTRVLNMTMDQWQTMYMTEEFKVVIHDFFDRDDNMMIVLNLNLEGTLIPSTGFPANPKTKSCYFIKKEPTIFIKDDPVFKYKVLQGDLAPNPLEHLVTFIENIVTPIINTELNQDNWPETVVADVKQHTQEICGVLYSVQGQLKGKTLLPIPLTPDVLEENAQRVTEGEPSDVDLQLKTQIETLVIKWSKHINDVLKQDSSKALQTGFPTPFAELAFWEDRVQDLQCIYDQLNEERVRKMAIILEKTGSTYWPSFKTMFRNVVASLAEAQDILVHLKPFKKHLDLVSGAEYSDIEALLRPMMHCVCLIWGHSKYYCSAARIIVLLQEIANLLIEQTRMYLGGSSIFQLTPEEGFVRAELAVKTLDYFRELYDGCREYLPVYFPETSDPKNWDFLQHLVFKRFDKFLDRCIQMRDFFDVSTEIYKLEQCDIGGSKGQLLSTKIHDMYNQYMAFYGKYAAIPYDCTDPEDDSYEADKAKMIAKVDDMNQRLNTILSDAVDDCHTPESCYKLIIVLGDIIERPAIKSGFEVKYQQYVKLIEDDLDHIKLLFDDQMFDVDIDDRVMTNNLLPSHSASISWLTGMLERANEEVEQFQSLELPIQESEDAQRMLKKHKTLTDILSKFKDQVNSSWKSKVNKDISDYLSENIVRREDSSSIVVNFSAELAMAMKDAKFMKQNGYEDIPGSAASILENRDNIHRNVVHLDQIARGYNKINRAANRYESDAIEQKVGEIDAILSKGEDSLKWSDYNGTWDFVQQLRGPITELLSQV